jgi:hypothetical protein
MYQHTGFAMVSTQRMLSHLFRTYGRIKPSDLEANDKRFKQAYDPNMPFETLIQQVDDAVEYAAHGENPYSQNQIITNAYNIIFNTGMFADACKEWRRQPDAYKTWTQFQYDFALAHDDWRNASNTSQYGGYQQANQLIETFASETAEAITHLANAAASDKDIVQQLTTANEKLTIIVTQQAEQITKLLAQIANNKKPKAHNNDDTKR